MDKQYLALLNKVLTTGVITKNRTGVDTLSIPSANFTFSGGFPLLSSKKVYYRGAIAEMQNFLIGTTSAETMRESGVRFWDANANSSKKWRESPFREGDDDMGRVYGSIWRAKPTYVTVSTEEQADVYKKLGYATVPNAKNIMVKNVDQLSDCIDLIINDPTNRNIIMHAAFSEFLPQQCLPACHLLYQFSVIGGKLHMALYQRSCDLFLGIPFNLVGASYLQHVMAEACGLRVGSFTHSMTNVHLYTNSLLAVEKQLEYTQTVSKPKPQLYLWDKKLLNQTPLEYVTMEHDYSVINYTPTRVKIPKVGMVV